MKPENDGAANERRSGDRIEPREREATGVVMKESRSHRRVRARLEVRVATIDACEDRPSGERFYLLTQATTLDVGDGGLKLECDGRVRSGQRVMVEVELENGASVECTGRVAWSADDATGQHFMGVRFDQEVPGLVTHALGTPRPA